MIKVFSAFSGIGGFDLAFMKVFGKENIKIVGFSEVDKYAKAIYYKQFRENMESNSDFGDITKIDTGKIPDIDILCGGSPCQNISVANNNRTGFRGEASGLFFDWAKILKAKKPKIFLFENVDGILHSNNGWDFARLLAEVDSAGYDVEWRVLNSADFSVPQRRMRCFVVGHLRGEPWRAVLSQSEEDGYHNETQKGTGSEGIQSAMRTNIAGAVVTSAFDKLANFIKVVHKEEPDFSGGRIHDVSEISPALTASEQPKIQIVNEGNYADRKVYDAENGLSPTLRTGFNHVPKIVVHSLQPRSSDVGTGGTGHLSKSDDKSYCLDTKNSQAIQIIQRCGDKEKNTYSSSNIAYSLTSNPPSDYPPGGIVEINKEQWRRLTPVECERLQAFPDNWTKLGFFKKGELIWNGETTLTKVSQLQPHMVTAKEDGIYPIVESARYHCLGNAVTVNVVQAICQRIKDVGLLK